MMTEAYNLGDKIVDYYGKSDTIVDQIGSISHMPLFFDMITKFKPTGADSFDKKSGSEIVELVSNAHGTIDRRKHFRRIENQSCADYQIYGLYFLSQVKSTIEGYTGILPYDKETTAAIEAYDKLTKDERKTFGTPDPRKSPIGKAWPNYNIGNHDNPRCANRFGSKLLDAMNMVIMMLQGSPITYYGDEIGMTDNDQISSNPDKRDPYRTPMQWDENANAGKFITQLEL